MRVPKDRSYSQDHLWVRLEQPRVRIGLTEYAAAELGQADYVDLPSSMGTVTRDEPFAAVETSKAVTDLIAPVSGLIIEANYDLQHEPGLLTEDPYGQGWLAVMELSDAHEMDLLLGPEEYEGLTTADIESFSEG
jgi:glycine cleavage system H protein